MSYNYTQEKPRLFTEGGLAIFTEIRDNAHRLLKVAGAFRAQEAWESVCGDSWLMIAALDLMVERKEIRELTSPNSVWGQYRVFVAVNHEA